MSSACIFERRRLLQQHDIGAAVGNFVRLRGEISTTEVNVPSGDAQPAASTRRRGGGGGGGGGLEPGANQTLTRCRLTLPVSNTTRIDCVPAFSVTVFRTVVQVCQPPVDGTPTPPVLSSPLNSTCSVPPPTEATRKSKL